MLSGSYGGSGVVDGVAGMERGDVVEETTAEVV